MHVFLDIKKQTDGRSAKRLVKPKQQRIIVIRQRGKCGKRLAAVHQPCHILTQRATNALNTLRQAAKASVPIAQPHMQHARHMVQTGLQKAIVSLHHTQTDHAPFQTADHTGLPVIRTVEPDDNVAIARAVKQRLPIRGDR